MQGFSQGGLEYYVRLWRKKTYRFKTSDFNSNLLTYTVYYFLIAWCLLQIILLEIAWCDYLTCINKIQQGIDSWDHLLAGQGGIYFDLWHAIHESI